MTIPKALLTIYLTFLKEMYTNRRNQVKKRVQIKKKNRFLRTYNLFINGPG